jgi:hypothetical protein
MKTLFLAEIDLTITDYMLPSKTKKEMRLVWGTDHADARAQIDAEYEGGDPYSSSTYVNWVNLTEALGSPRLILDQ